MLRSYWKSTYLRELSDEALDLVAKTTQARPTKRTLVAVFSWGGAINRVRAEETAHSERSANWMVSIDGNWEDPAEDDKVIAWVRERWAQLHRLGTGSTYLNFTGIAGETCGRRSRGRVRTEPRTSGRDQDSATTRTTSSG